MKIQSVNNIKYNNSLTFAGKFSQIPPIVTDKSFTENITKLSGNKEANELFKGLSVIAGSFLTGVALYAQQNEKAKTFINNLFQQLGLDNNDNITAGYKQLFNTQANNNTEEIKETDNITVQANKSQEQTEEPDNNNPEREVYLKLTSYFPNLDKQYKNLLKTSIKEPQNEKNNIALNVIESLFKYMTEDSQRLISMKPYLQTIENYSSDLNDIAENIVSTIKGGKTPLSYLVMLNNGKINDNDIKKWAKASNLSLNEFMLCKHFDDKVNINISNVKEKYNNKFSIKDIDGKKDENNKDDNTKYTYRLEFDPDINIHERMKIVKDMHEAIYGEPVCFTHSKEYGSEHLEHDIQTELLDNIIKDRRLDSTFTFMKFIRPKIFKNINLTSQEVKFLQKDSNEYKQIKDICANGLINLDLNNPHLKELCSVLEDENLFRDIFSTRHSKMRFITRVVLKDDPNPKNFTKRCEEKMEKFEKELMNNSDKCYYYCYRHPKGLAPQFYLGKSKLGNYIKITLNSEGYIHTIYEDFNKEAKESSETK